MPRASRPRSSCDSSSTSPPPRDTADHRAPAARTPAAGMRRWAHEPPSTPCDPRCARTRCRLHGAARGPARRLPAPATDRIGERADVYLAADAARPPSASLEGDDGGATAATDAPRRGARCPRCRAPAAPGLVVLRVYDAERAGESIARELEAMSADASGTLPGLLDVAIARRRPVLPRRRATRRARAVAHHRRAHPEPG